MQIIRKTGVMLALLPALGAAAISSAHAAIVSGFNANTLAPNDDSSTGSVSLPFTADFFGTNYTSLFVNNNGNQTFASALGTFTPFNLYTTNTPIIAPFFADVDTQFAGDPVTYGTGTYNGFAAFGVNYLNVDYYSSSTSHTNRDNFQDILVDRSDTGAGNFDIVFNYGSMQWETGQASGGDANGLGGSSARVGYSNGTATNSYELTGSGVNGSFINGGPDALNGQTLVFQVRNGSVAPPIITSAAVPEPSSLGLLVPGLLGILAVARRRRPA